jgi:hypothetical protein
VQDRGYPDISGLASGLGTGTAVIVQREKKKKKGGKIQKRRQESKKEMKRGEDKR